MTAARSESWPLDGVARERLADAVRLADHHGREAIEHARRAGGVLHELAWALNRGAPLSASQCLQLELPCPHQQAAEFIALHREAASRERTGQRPEPPVWHDLEAMTRSINRGQEGDCRHLEAALAGAAQLVTRQRRSIPGLARIKQAAEALARACSEEG